MNKIENKEKKRKKKKRKIKKHNKIEVKYDNNNN